MRLIVSTIARNCFVSPTRVFEAAPVIVVFDGISVDGLVRASVHGKVGLPVSIEVQLSQYHPVRNRFLEDPRAHRHPLPLNFAGKPYVYREEFDLTRHCFLMLSGSTRSNLRCLIA